MKKECIYTIMYYYAQYPTWLRAEHCKYILSFVGVIKCGLLVYQITNLFLVCSYMIEPLLSPVGTHSQCGSYVKLIITII